LLKPLFEWRLVFTAPGAIARFQSVARGVRRVVSIHFFNVLNPCRVADQPWQRTDQLCTIFREPPFTAVQHLIHQHPATDSVIVRRHWSRPSRRSEHIPHLVRNGSLVGPMRKGVRRKIYRINFFAPRIGRLARTSGTNLAFAYTPGNDFSRQFPRRCSARHVLPIGDDRSPRFAIPLIRSLAGPVICGRALPVLSPLGYSSVPIGRRRMLETPVNGYPARPPCLPCNRFGPHRVCSRIESVEILSGEDLPVALQESPSQMRGQRAQCFQVLPVAGVDRIVLHPRGDKLIVIW